MRKVHYEYTVPTVADRIGQQVVKARIEGEFEELFHPDSYGYRPNKSAADAVAVTRERCWKYDWCVEFDIRRAFDELDWDLMRKVIRKHVKDPWALLYIERWLTAPAVTPNGQAVQRSKGVPQGSVIGPVLMNAYMHYTFDRWMRRQYPQCPFARYADDAVVHCRSRAEAERLLAAIAGRLKECKLELHPEKSGVVYCKDSNRRALPPDTVYVPGVHVPAETRPRPRREVLDELPACGECSGDEADVSEHPRVAYPKTNLRRSA